MNDVFLSYARADRLRARMLFEVLRNQGLSVWWDSKVMPGESWRSTIRRELTGAKCVVVLWSTASIESRWVQAEAEDASNRGILFPVLIDDVNPPIGFGGIQNANLVGWAGEADNEEIWNLSEAIRTRLSEISVASVEHVSSPNSGGAIAADRRPPTLTNQAAASENMASAGSRAAASPLKSLEAPDLEGLKKELAMYIGPMARVIVARAAKNSSSLRQLYETVAAEIRSPADRQKFLASRVF